MIHSRFRLRQCVLILAGLVAALFAGTQSIAAEVGAAADRAFFRAPDSPWDVLALIGFLLGIVAFGLLLQAWMAHAASLEKIEKLEGKMKQQKTAHETSNLGRKTEIAKLEETCGNLQESSVKLQGGIESHRIMISQLSRDVEALKRYCNYVESRLKSLEAVSPGAGVASASNRLDADSIAALSGGISIPSEGLATLQVPNIDDCIAALNRGDKAVLRSKARAELNITPESEDALQRGSPGLNTRLKQVNGGGSYLLVEKDSKHWLLPTVQTLSTFSSNQPQKGIFDYEREPVTVPELSRAAELQAIDGIWEVVCKGVVIVPA